MPLNHADIIFFALVAIYLGLKLFSVLGKKNENDVKLESRGMTLGLGDVLGNKNINQPNAINADSKPQPVIKNNLDDFKFSSDEAKNGIKEIIEKDPNFSLEMFVEGAKIAFEMLFKAFSENDKVTLKNLLSDEVYSNFESQLQDLQSKNLVHQKSLVAIEGAEIYSASVAGSRVKIALKFLTEQINVTKDSSGNVVEGDPKVIVNVEDICEFERNTRSSNPNWTVVSL